MFSSVTPLDDDVIPVNIKTSLPTWLNCLPIVLTPLQEAINVTEIMKNVVTFLVNM